MYNNKFFAFVFSVNHTCCSNGMYSCHILRYNFTLNEFAFDCKKQRQENHWNLQRIHVACVNISNSMGIPWKLRLLICFDDRNSIANCFKKNIFNKQHSNSFPWKFRWQIIVKFNWKRNNLRDEKKRKLHIFQVVWIMYIKSKKTGILYEYIVTV